MYDHFGKSKAALILADMVKDKPKTRKRVGDILSKFNECLHDLKKLEKPHALHLAKLLQDDKIRIVNESEQFNQQTRMLTCNVINGLFKNFMKDVAL